MSDAAPHTPRAETRLPRGHALSACDGPPSLTQLAGHPGACYGRAVVHPPGEQVRSEVAIVCQLARELLGPGHPVPWERFTDDYDTIRDAIAAAGPGGWAAILPQALADGLPLPPGVRARPLSGGPGNMVGLVLAAREPLPPLLEAMVQVTGHAFDR